MSSSDAFPRPTFTPHENTPPLTIILTLILLVFLFIGFFSIYFCRCVMESILHSRNLRRTPSGNLLGGPSSSQSPPAAVTSSGLDPLLIKSFPTFPYSGIKDFRHDKFALECAICLLEFDDHSFLRLLTACCHVFHQECIDLWLQSHKTCPVCRGNLDSPPHSPHRVSDHESIEDAISIDIDRDDDDDIEPNDHKTEHHEQNTEHHEEEEQSVKKFSRSHSTGHSIVKKIKEEGDRDRDRHTLILPEHIKIKLIRGHNWTGSCVTFEEFSRTPSSAGGFLEVSESDHNKIEDKA